MQKFRFAVKRLLQAIVFLAALSPGFRLANAAKGSAPTVSFRLQTEPPSLDWNKAMDSVSFRVIGQLMEGLTEIGEGYSVRPALAESWTVSKDGKTYVFKLREGLRWSDGQPLVAQHFVDSWIRLLAPATAAPSANLLADVKGAEEFIKGDLKDAKELGFAALDERSIEIRLKEPTPHFPGILSYTSAFPVRLDVVRRHGDRWTEPGNFPTVGAYRLAARAPGESLRLEPNPFARVRELGRAAAASADRRKRPNVLMRIIEDDSTAVRLFEAGDLDVVPYLPPMDFPLLSKRSEFEPHEWPRASGYAFYAKAKPFDDARVRRAFARAVDRAKMGKVLGGAVSAARTWVPSGFEDHAGDVGLAHDPAEARRLLADAGFPGGKGFPNVEAYFDARDDNRLVAEYLQSEWKTTLGVRVRFVGEEWKALLKRMRSGEPPALHRIGWGMIYPSAYDFLSPFASGGSNRTGWQNSRFDRVLAEARREPAEAKRKELYRTAQKILVEEEAIVIPLFQESASMLVSKRLKGLRVVAGRVYLDSAELETR